MSFVFIDWLVVGAFFAILLAIPFVIAKRDDGKKERYFNGGGSMPWWLIGISMTAAMTSTNSANLFTQLIRENGMSGNWVWWAFLTGGILTVFVYAKLWHRLEATTDIAFYELRYSGKPGEPFWRIDRSKPYEIAPDLLKEYEGNMEDFRAMIEYNAKENFGSAAAYGVSDDAAKKPGEKSGTNAAGLKYNPMMD